MRLLAPIFLLLAVWPGRGHAHDSTLKKLQIIHRHGFRSTAVSTYGNYKDCFPTTELGNLTELGRSQMSFLGYFLRMHYDSFIGRNASQTQMVYSDYPRNYQSAKLVFDGLFSEYNHSGINFTRIDPAVDGPLSVDTDAYHESFGTMLDVNNYKPLMQRINDVGKTLSPIKELWQLFDVADQLVCELSNHCPPAAWMDTSIVNGLLDVHDAYFRSFTRCRNENIVKENSDLMINLMNKNFAELTSDDSYKAHLYSSHDTNIAALLARMGLYNGLDVPFGAFVVFELHGEQNKEDYVEVFYYNSTDYQTPYQLTYPEWSAGIPRRDFLRKSTGTFDCV